MLMPSAAGLSAVGAVGAPGPDELVSGLGALAGATPQQKDTTWTKLFVGGLPYHTTDKSLREHFSVYGDIEEAVVITDRQTGKSRGYGFVIMGDRAAAERACKDPNPIIDGRKANVNLAILGAKPRGNLQTILQCLVIPRSTILLISNLFSTESTYVCTGAFYDSDINTYVGKVSVLCKSYLPYRMSNDTKTLLDFTFPFAAGIRAGYPAVLPGQYGVPPGYVYQSPYLAAAAPGGLVPLPATQLSHAAAVAATQFYDYQNVAAAAATYPGTSYNFAEAYPYSSAAAAGMFHLKNTQEKENHHYCHDTYDNHDDRDDITYYNYNDQIDNYDNIDSEYDTNYLGHLPYKDLLTISNTDYLDHQDYSDHQNYYEDHQNYYEDHENYYEDLQNDHEDYQNDLNHFSCEEHQDCLDYLPYEEHLNDTEHVNGQNTYPTLRDHRYCHHYHQQQCWLNNKLNAAAGYVTPYTYATLPGAAGLPAAAAAATAGAAFPGLPYQTTPQEARLQ
ncbi:hypothetical protein M0804_012923 [Polistes exclamans]|nr:hypothetical protein M0804_012923 [Polistes exclamans]